MSAAIALASAPKPSRSLRRKPAEQLPSKRCAPIPWDTRPINDIASHYQDYSRAATRELTSAVEQHTDRDKSAKRVPTECVYRRASCNFSIGAPRNFSSRELVNLRGHADTFQVQGSLENSGRHRLANAK